MKYRHSSTIFLKVVLFLIGIAILALCIFGIPAIAIKDAMAHPQSAYVAYLFVGYAYIACIPFYTALYQAYRLLSNIDQNKAFSPSSIKALATIKYCAITIISLIVLGIFIALVLFSGKEDITGIIMLALISLLASSAIATFATVLQKLLQQALTMQYENELTV
ncbi:DUF2975 domain-containing protein [Lysinibacillus piscis]|uniref:Membrane protein YoaS n=1 Tax=Lysinibacillus piscis TaxID=2518931 RepID=A0ABQ5NM20_9BACI|nr:DUF2975 domain-containing protein [Lysinibacillus sp. KH24]GLC89152.1 putative membrane protein YoaS [Lysinibacillus sp. KH24]